MRKNYFAKALILGAAMLLALACTKEGNQKKVAVLLPDSSSLDRWATDKSNLETVMASYGFNTTFYIAPETEAGAAQQVDQLRDAIKAGRIDPPQMPHGEILYVMQVMDGLRRDWGVRFPMD